MTWAEWAILATLAAEWLFFIYWASGWRPWS